VQEGSEHEHLHICSFLQADDPGISAHSQYMREIVRRIGSPVQQTNAVQELLEIEIIIDHRDYPAS